MKNISVNLSYMKYLLFLLITISSCAGGRNTTRINFEQVHIALTTFIPKGYTLKTVPGINELQHEYRYADTAMFYISGMGLLLNYPEINSSGSYPNPYLFRNRQNPSECDTLSFSGVNGQGYYWREFLWGSAVVGYMHVSKDKKESFDQAIDKLKRRGCKR